MSDLTVPPTEIEIAEALDAVIRIAGRENQIPMVIRRLVFERDRLREGLKNIAGHSVCCDARHIADKLLANQLLEEMD